MSVKIRIKNERVYLDVIYDRKHHWESLGICLSADKKTRREQLKLAALCRAKREMQLLCSEWELPVRVIGDRMLFSFVSCVKNRTEGKSRKKSIGALLRLLRAFQAEDRQLSAVDSAFAEDFQVWLLESGDLMESSVKSYMLLFRTLMNMAVKEGFLRENPLNEVRILSAADSDLPVLSAAEVRRLSETAADGDFSSECKRAFLFACVTGLRYSDLKTLRFSDTVEKDGAIWIRKRQVKTGKMAEIPLNQVARRLLGEGDGNVFNLCKSYFTSLRMIKMWAEKAGISKNIGWHTARRTFATLSLERGTDVFTIQRLLGHSRISTTALYAKSGGIKAEAVNRLDDIFPNV